MTGTEQTRWFLIAFAAGTVVAGAVLWKTSSDLSATSTEWDGTVSELSRLQRRNPYPNEANLTVLKRQGADDKVLLGKLKADLQKRVPPSAPLAPNELQARLRQAVTAVTERARASQVQLPENFFLGFDEFSSGLPDTAVAPLLGQQLSQVEALMDILIEAHVDAITSFQRGRLPEERPATITPTPSRQGPATPNESKAILRSTVEVSFISNPTALRHVLNDIGGSPQHFFIVRTLQVLNVKEKGPARAATAATLGAARAGALNFIVGNEKVQTHAIIELLRFNLE